MDLVTFEVYINEDLTLEIKTDRNRLKEHLEVSFFNIFFLNVTKINTTIFIKFYFFRSYLFTGNNKSRIE